MKKFIAENDINFYTIDAIGIAKELGLGNKTSIVLQSAFFKIANVIPFEDAVGYMKDAVVKSFGAKGEKIVNMNHAAIAEGEKNIKKIDVPAEWANAADEAAAKADVPEFVEKIQMPCNAQAGDKLALEVLDEYYEYLGEFLGTLCSVINPEAVVLGGGVSKAGQVLIDGVEPYFHKYVFHAASGARFALASLFNDAGAYGAFKLVLDEK